MADTNSTKSVKGIEVVTNRVTEAYRSGSGDYIRALREEAQRGRKLLTEAAERRVTRVLKSNR